MTAAERQRPPSAAREARLREIQANARPPTSARGPNSSRGVSYADNYNAANAMMPPPPPMAAMPPMPSQAAEDAVALAPYVEEVMKESEELLALMDEVRAALKARAADPDGKDSGLAGLARTFRASDEDGSGTLGLAEFSRAIARCKLGLQPSAVARLFASFDRNGSGVLPYEEFLSAVGGKMGAVRKALVVAAFNALDAASNGLTIEHLEAEYGASKHPEVTNAL